MEQMLDRIKERVAQRDSPIKTVKGLVGAIGMSEAGFYTMLKRQTTKPGTLLAMADALKVDPSYLSEDLDRNISKTKPGEDTLQAIMRDMHDMKLMFEEQLRAKDAQIAGLLKTVDTLAGKSEGANWNQLFTPTGDFSTDLRTYAKAAMLNIQTMGSPIFLTPQVAK